MNVFSILAVFFILFLVELIYFKIADYYDIIDKPNHRSSHTSVTLRGGGIIFSLSLLLYPLVFHFPYTYFLIGLAMISLISFLDDIRPVSNKLRIVVHLLSVALMFYQLDLFHLPFFLIILSLIFVIGSINAINFMDGINGITGGYSLISLVTLLYIDKYLVEFVDSNVLVIVIIAVLVFNYFNFRSKAKCFAGDVGSVSIAFIIVFFLLRLIVKTENLNYLLVLLMYGLDAVSTIVFRLIKREKIFEPHRSHFYQYWANERKIPHVVVSAAYAILQLIINIILLVTAPKSIFVFFISICLSFILFIVSRFLTEGSKKLLYN